MHNLLFKTKGFARVGLSLSHPSPLEPLLTSGAASGPVRGWAAPAQPEG